MASSLLLSGAKVLCYVNGVLAGACTSFSWSSQSPKRPLQGLDVLAPVELIPGPVSVSGSLSLVRQSNDGGAEALGLSALFGDVEKYYVLALVDRTNGQTLFQARQCQSQSQSWDVRPQQLVRGQVSFIGLYWNNEAQ